LDFTKVSSDPLSFNVPPSIHWRVTIAFWVFVHDTIKYSTKNINIIYKDFMTVSMFIESTPYNNLSFACTPIEYIYSVQGQSSNSVKTYLNNMNASYQKDIITNASSKWIYIQCGFNYDNYEYYLNTIAPTSLPVPQQYSGLSVHYNWFQKKFYDKTGTTTFSIEGHSSVATEVYYRNFNIFREYLPQSMIDIKYLYDYILF
jgi:hypothetical protein